MMKLPAYMQKQFADGASVSVFQDDAMFWKFYLIPGFPTVRTDVNGNPVFMLIKYAFSDQSREENPDLPRGGGYMVFDSELKVTEDQREEIKKDLEPMIRKEWEELKNESNEPVRKLKLKAVFNDSINQHWNNPGMTGTPRGTPQQSSDTTLELPKPDTPMPPAELPPVIFGEPLWKSGKVTMNAPQSAGLVSHKIGERPASLLGNNVAAFNLDLTPDGATFMQKTLVGDDGRGATDLTPIQVIYELSMLAKLPPASMYVKFNTASLYHTVQELFHEHHNCTDDYFTSESMMSTAIEAGMVTIKIDAGGIDDEEILQQLMQQAQSQVQELLSDRFANKERAPMEEWADEDVQESSAEIYRLKQVTEVDMTDYESTMTISPTTEFKIAPQGTLQAFFKGKNDMTPFVREVDLDDEFFKTLGVKARAFAKWEEDDVAFVELEMKYGQGDQLKTQTFTFTPESKDPMEWDPSLIDGKREYQYRSRIAFEGREAGDWSRWEKTTTRNLNIAVETPGKLAVEVLGVGLDFENVLDAVLVHMRYADPANDVPMAGQSVLLAKERPSGNWNRQLFAPWDKPLEYRVEYLLKSGTSVEEPWIKTDGPTQNLPIKRPKNIDVLDLTLIPAGKWADVIQAVLSLRYIDGNYNRDAQFNFAKPDEFKKWAVLLLNARQRKFEYKVLATFKNGDTQETAWLSREGDQALPVLVEGPPRLDVKITGAVLDYVSTPLVKVDLEYTDPQGTPDVQSISLQKPEDVTTWSVPIRKDGPRGYRKKITYFPAQGDPVEREWEIDETELIVVPRYQIPKVGADFLPNLQDFALTPVVEVNIAYDDPQRDARERMTLVFTKNERQSWFLPVPDDAPRAYEYTVTWYYASGTDKTSTPVKLEKPSVTLPRPPKPAAAPVQ